MKFSLIISNYQGRHFLQRCLESIFAQTYRNFEVIFVDAGSSDGSADFVESQFPDVRVFRRGRIGIGEAVNIGLRAARGDILVFDLNTDEFVRPDWLAQLLAFMDHYQYRIIAGTTRLMAGTDRIDEAGVRVNRLGRAVKIGHGKRVETFRFSDGPVDFVGMPAFHRNLLNIVGFLDEAYYLYAEDLDFCHRARRLGIRSYCAPLARSEHLIRGSIGGNPERLEYYLRRANIRFHMIYSDPARALTHFLYAGLFLTAGAFAAGIVGGGHAALYRKKFKGRWRALRWHGRNCKKTYALRKAVSQILPCSH